MIIDELITDRTQADVDRVKALTQKWLDGTITNAEKSEWLAGMKGAYNYTDLNRVGEAVRYVAGVLNSTGRSVSVTGKMDWTMEDIPTRSQESQFLADLRLLKANVSVSIPDVPTTLDNLTVEKANRIEEIIIAVYNAINRERADMAICGLAISGVEGGL